MKTREDFLKELDNIELPKRKDLKWYKDNFNLDEYAEEVFTYDIENIYLTNILHVDEIISKKKLQFYFNSFINKLDNNSKIKLVEEHSYSDYDIYFEISTPTGKKLESEDSVYRKLQDWLNEYVKERRDYKKYLELKNKFESN